MKVLNETTESSGEIKLSRTALIEGMSQEIEMLRKEVERLSAKLEIPDEEIEHRLRNVTGFDYEAGFDTGVRWALEYLNAQRKGGG